MAKKTTKGNEGAKIKFIMLEAELPDGDLSQITSAIQNALKPVAPESVRIIQSYGDGSDNIFDSGSIEEIQSEDSGATDDRVDGKPKSNKRSNGPRKPINHTVVDLDLDTDPSWADFVAQHSPKSDNDKFLIVASFFKECRGAPEVSKDIAYTCFRRAGWASNIADFGQPFRNLKVRGFVKSGGEKGTFEINHLGQARVDEMKLG